MTQGLLGGLPSSMLDSDVELVQSIIGAYEEFITRLNNTPDDLRGHQGQNWDLHLGVPNPKNMPPGDLNVWLHFANARVTDQSTFTTDIYDTIWEIYVTARKTDTDEFGFDPLPALITVGTIEHRLRDTNTDLALDGQLEVNNEFDIQHDILRPEEQGEHDLWLMTVNASLGLINCRT